MINLRKRIMPTINIEEMQDWPIFAPYKIKLDI